MAFSYFTAKEVGEGIYQITNGIFDDTLPTFCYLVVGEKAAMLVDSMYGVGSLKEFCETLTDKPIIHVATHFHGDHTGGSCEFPDLWMSPRDFELFYKNLEAAKELLAKGEEPAAMRTAKRRTLPQYQSELRAEDMILPKDVRLHPLFEGDVIDLGGKEIEVIEVFGHTPGEIVLLDRKARCLYSGDACNTNTLLNLHGDVSVREYLENLIKLNGRLDEFDTLFNGHDIQKASIVAEGIELCTKIVAREDDQVPGSAFGRPCFVAAKRIEGTMDRADGKVYNAVYNPAWIDEAGEKNNVITA